MDRFGPAGASPLVTLPNGQQGAVDEDLATGQEGTVVPSLWGNALTEEMMSILAAADVTPNINNWGQVLASLQTLFGGGGGLGDSGWQKLPGGLIIQWTLVAVPEDTFELAYPLPTTFPANCFFVGCSIGAYASAEYYGNAGLGAAPDPGHLGSVLISNANTFPSALSIYILALGN